MERHLSPVTEKIGCVTFFPLFISFYIFILFIIYALENYLSLLHTFAHVVVSHNCLQNCGCLGYIQTAPQPSLIIQMEFFVESPAAFAPSMFPCGVDSDCSLYRVRVSKEWGAGYLTAMKLWESHHQPRYNITKQLLIKCASLC